MDVNRNMPHRTSGTRRMHHMQRVLDTIFKSYEGYAAHLQNESHVNAKAEGLAKLLTNYHVIVFAPLLRVISLFG